jgi:hypothetical protein
MFRAAAEPVQREGRFMQRFFDEQNIKRYRQLASGALTAAERQALFTALSEEATSFRNSPRLSAPAADMPG